MIVISDTNILSSFAAGDSVHLLFRLFSQARIGIPPAVLKELQDARERGISYLEAIFQAIAADQIEVLPLSTEEDHLMQYLPPKLNAGERQAIAVSQNRKFDLLCNDKRAVLYCRERKIRVFNLPDVLRLLWLRRILSPDAVSALIRRMEQVENLQLSEAQQTTIFAPRRRKT